MARDAHPTEHALALIGEVRWRGAALVGERSRELFALLALHPDGLGDGRLIEQLWGDAVPANPAKALQVVVSRARAATARDAVLRTPGGYRLGLAAGEVDAWRLAGLVEAARKHIGSGDARAACEAAAEALRLPAAAGTADGALGRLRWLAAQHRRAAGGLLGIALSEEGRHAEAVEPLRAAVQRDPSDERSLTCLLRSEAAVHGTGAALQRYAHYRAGLAERTGADPGPRLRAVHAELLAADRPVRAGVRFDAEGLLGRTDDLRELRGIVRGARVTSIVGPGGLGKTRLAHVLGRDAEQPLVWFVELVGVSAPEDVVGEVGSVLGVRDSVGERRTLTPAQRADVRSRIAARLDGVPALLILDNCEHVVDAVAELVAFLVASTAELRVLTTGRSPLNLGAERVYPLGVLDEADAAELFRRRAVAARPGVRLGDAVTEVVRRLDGLPLAIELAAAKTRVMSVEDVAARLEHRFALLRGGDRGAPDRHRTLLAVIDWSWNLLGERDRAALATLSVFQDGFTLETAEAVLGAAALEPVQNLAEQSLLTVRETGGGVRYGMLETVREFGKLRLVEAGAEAEALAAQRDWAKAYARRCVEGLRGTGQPETMDRLRHEEANLAEVLRRGLAASDRETVVVLLAALARFWTMSGEHERILSMLAALEQALAGWRPPPELADETRHALVSLLFMTGMLGGELRTPLWELLYELGPGTGPADLAAVVTVTLAADPQRRDRRAALRRLCDHPDRLIAGQALVTHGHEVENAGAPEQALDCFERAVALAAQDDGPWWTAMLHRQLAGLYGQLGRHREAAVYAERALPDLDRLGAYDESSDVRVLLVAAALAEGAVGEAARQVDAFSAPTGRLTREHMTGTIIAELALAEGRTDRGLALYREAADRSAAFRVPGNLTLTGLEPWTLMVQAAALSAHAGWGSGAAGTQLFDTLLTKAARSLAPGNQRLDYPVAGMVFYALAAWSLSRGGLEVAEAVRLAVLAERFGYNRLLPTMPWAALAASAESAAPGLLGEIDAGYGPRRGERLLAEARAFVEGLRPRR